MLSLVQTIRHQLGKFEQPTREVVDSRGKIKSYPKYVFHELILDGKEKSKKIFIEIPCKMFAVIRGKHKSENDKFTKVKKAFLIPAKVVKYIFKGTRFCSENLKMFNLGFLALKVGTVIPVIGIICSALSVIKSSIHLSFSASLFLKERRKRKTINAKLKKWQDIEDADKEKLLSHYQDKLATIHRKMVDCNLRNEESGALREQEYKYNRMIHEIKVDGIQCLKNRKIMSYRSKAILQEIEYTDKKSDLMRKVAALGFSLLSIPAQFIPPGFSTLAAGSLLVGEYCVIKWIKRRGLIKIEELKAQYIALHH